MIILESLHTKPNRFAIPVPYFVRLSEVKSDAEKYELKNDVMYFSSDVSTINLFWETEEATFENTIQKILLSYRKEPGVRWQGGAENIDSMDAIAIMDSGADLFPTPAGPGFLLTEEEILPTEHLSFDLIKKAFSIEYTRRFEEYIESGKKALPLQSPYKPLEPM